MIRNPQNGAIQMIMKRESYIKQSNSSSNEFTLRGMR
eukprot:CAMPEP_0168315124 /NCGR_PEP_ID=MMETSP0210-20121227/10201_1 /TAXON_ID=40633 /ORGANISM="Condylostoma magnum, Strain COL2" /LENGTH=36 /DNA_ID= /DNA_START= /DNA_END= /DNA_ORIENTATION=